MINIIKYYMLKWFIMLTLKNWNNKCDCNSCNNLRQTLIKTVKSVKGYHKRQIRYLKDLHNNLKYMNTFDNKEAHQ